MSKRRREILAIAADLFADRGFANVTVDDIGEAAGVSGPALYHHFAGKEALLGEMLVDISEYLLAGGTKVVAEHGTSDPDPDADTLLARLIRFHAEFAVEHRSLITVHFRDLVHASEVDQARVRNLQSRYVGLWCAELQRRSPALPRRGAGHGARDLRPDQLDAVQRPAAAGGHARAPRRHGRRRAPRRAPVGSGARGTGMTCAIAHRAAQSRGCHHLGWQRRPVASAPDHSSCDSERRGRTAWDNDDRAGA